MAGKGGILQSDARSIRTSNLLQFHTQTNTSLLTDTSNHFY
ncbi:hypothetical protein SynA1825c_02102 [Synechococcus sp. A18-25c]|nr:hypothetical protein SynA1560_02116 [Synechococcus sp. A15-60]QNJ20399.1 hypothetical protein SynA1825c_02102 [Synechococcus sp. A18-25c]